MYLGIYDIDGDPDELLAAYDRVMARMPEGQVYFHACAVRENGITIYDACPTREAFETVRVPSGAAQRGLDPVGATAIGRRFQLALAWLATGALFGAVLAVLGVAVIAAFNALYWLPIRGESPRPRPS
jgi:hypothetical protein